MAGQLGDALVAAVRAEVISVGLRRATMTSIARRAGLSRATLHRRAQTTHQLVLDALVHEYTRALEDAVAVADAEQSPHRRARIAAVARAAVQRFWDDPLITALLEHDPEMLLPYLVDRLGRSQEVLLELLTREVTAGQEDGSVRTGDARRLAVVVLQSLTPFVVGRRVLTGTDELADWVVEAGHLVDSYLAPEAA